MLQKRILMSACAALVAALALCAGVVKAEPAMAADNEQPAAEAVGEEGGMVMGKDEATGIRYISFGRGPKTMVIVPGLTIGYVTDSAAAVAEGYAAFGEDYTVYLFDIREEVPEGYTMDMMGQDLAAAIRNLGLRDLYLYGCSMGGMQTVYLAGACPELVKKAAVISSACEANETFTATLSGWLHSAEAGELRALTADMGQKIYSAPVYESLKAVFEAMADGMDETALARFLNTAGAMVGLDLTEEAARITCPVLVIGSAGDRVVTGAASERIAELTGGELYLYGEEYPHAIYDEAPDLRDRVKAFFDAETAD